jgi:hypothetical protein
MIGAFSAPHSAHVLLRVVVGGVSPGFATKLFQYLGQIHYISPGVFAAPMIIPPVMIETGPLLIS